MMSDLAPIFAELRSVMLRAAQGMTVAKDGPGGLLLLAHWPNPAKPKERMWFGSVGTAKAYVSYHLMPVYSHPELLEGLSPALRKRMQGKSCFNFKAIDPALIEELARLTEAGAALYAEPFTLPERGVRA